MWYYDVVGEGRCPIVDTWWQTETGGIMITPLPGATPTEAGLGDPAVARHRAAAGRRRGQRARGRRPSGNLVPRRPWPGQMRTVWGDHERFFQTYFTTYPGLYFTGDGCRRDEDGYYWITGRVDDVINVSGHRIGTAEVESALVAHHDVAEAAVVGCPHDIKGQGIYAFVTLKAGAKASDALQGRAQRSKCAATSARIAIPESIQFAPACPRPARARSCAASCASSPKGDRRLRRHFDARRPVGRRSPCNGAWSEVTPARL